MADRHGACSSNNRAMKSVCFGAICLITIFLVLYLGTLLSSLLRLVAVGRLVSYCLSSSADCALGRRCRTFFIIVVAYPTETVASARPIGVLKCISGASAKLWHARDVSTLASPSSRYKNIKIFITILKFLRQISCAFAPRFDGSRAPKCRRSSSAKSVFQQAGESLPFKKRKGLICCCFHLLAWLRQSAKVESECVCPLRQSNLSVIGQQFMQVNGERSEIAAVIAGADAEDAGAAGCLDAHTHGLFNSGEIESVDDDFVDS